MSWDSEHFDPLPPTSIEPPPQPQKHWLKRLLAPLSGIALLIWKLGPVLGAIGAAICLGVAIETNSDLLRAVAYTAFFLNLFNLIPVVPLDGGRAAAAFHPAFWFVGVFAVALLFFWHPNPLILVIALLGCYELFHRWGHRNDPQAQAYYATPWRQRLTIGVVYLALIGLLVLGMEASYLHRSF